MTTAPKYTTGLDRAVARLRAAIENLDNSYEQKREVPCEDSHLELGLMESAAAGPSSFERWVDVVEQKLGHDLDGSQSRDGYSLDYALDAYRDGNTCDQYVAQVLEAKKAGGRNEPA